MNKTQNNTKYDLEERTFSFAKNIRKFIQKLPKNILNLDDIRQLIRSSGSIGANYREANDALGKKDFIMRIRICRKEAKESLYWLRLLGIDDNAFNATRDNLQQEAREFINIFGAIIRNYLKK